MTFAAAIDLTDLVTLPLFAWAFPMPKRRSDGRFYDTGLQRPYRPCPPDFRDKFLEMGWDGIDEHYRANWRCIARWIEECGGDELRAERFNLAGRKTGGKLQPGRRARRYVMGQTLTERRK